MDFFELNLAKKLAESEGGDGGGSSIDVEPLSVTANGTYTAPEGTAYSPVNVNVSGGGVETKDINFYDYDGTLLHSYTFAEWSTVSELPANPSRTGLTAQGWNYTKSDIDAELLAQPDVPVNVGQMYITESGATEIDVNIPVDSFDVYLALCPNGTTNIDWGDNNEDAISGSSTSTKINTKHTFASAGKYTISIDVQTGSLGLSGGVASDQKPVINDGKAVPVNYPQANTSIVEAVRIGSGVTEIGDYTFYSFDAKYITIPSSQITSLGDSCFSMMSFINHLTIPNSVTTMGVSFCTGCHSLGTISIPTSVTTIGASCFSQVNLKELSVPSSVTSLGSFSNMYDLERFSYPVSITTVNSLGSPRKIKRIVIPEGVTEISASALANCYGLEYVFIPKTVTTIANYAFRYLYKLREMHIEATTPPTLGTNATQGFPSYPYCKIYVPYSADHSILNAYKAASNWSAIASRIQEEPQ